MIDLSRYKSVVWASHNVTAFVTSVAIARHIATVTGAQPRGYFVTWEDDPRTIIPEKDRPLVYVGVLSGDEINKFPEGSLIIAKVYGLEDPPEPLDPTDVSGRTLVLVPSTGLITHGTEYVAALKAIRVNETEIENLKRLMGMRVSLLKTLSVTGNWLKAFYLMVSSQDPIKAVKELPTELDYFGKLRKILLKLVVSDMAGNNLIAAIDVSPDKPKKYAVFADGFIPMPVIAVMGRGKGGGTVITVISKTPLPYQLLKRIADALGATERKGGTKRFSLYVPTKLSADDVVEKLTPLLEEYMEKGRGSTKKRVSIQALAPAISG